MGTTTHCHDCNESDLLCINSRALLVSVFSPTRGVYRGKGFRSGGGPLALLKRHAGNGFVSTRDGGRREEEARQRRSNSRAAISLGRIPVPETLNSWSGNEITLSWTSTSPGYWDGRGKVSLRVAARHAASPLSARRFHQDPGRRLARRAPLYSDPWSLCPVSVSAHPSASLRVFVCLSASLFSSLSLF